MIPTVLVVSFPQDRTAELVADVLVRRGSTRVVCFDVADFPLTVELSVQGPPWTGRMDTPGGGFDLAEVCGVLYRRPTQYRFPAAMSDRNRQFVAGEARVGLGGVLCGLACRWVNHPARAADAEYKPLQLQVARELGLVTPRTLVTNSPRAAKDFASSLPGPVVYKTLHGLSLERGGQELVVYTSVVDVEDLDDEAIRLTAHLFQEWVPKVYDVRATVIGDRCFAVAIDAGSAKAHIDFRADYGAVGYRPVDLSEDLRARLRAYLDHFGLAFGAFDLVVSPAGTTVFLECNSNGQWGWLQDETGMPIAEAMADYLLGA